MKKYIIEITETLQNQITVQANSREEAEQIIKEKYDSGDIVLNENDLMDTNIKCVKEQKFLNDRER
ncbi:DpnD/PcfM family protein [Faecalibacillus intestinalis]|uniref:DpnD/PcfM family protein n=1 Tax=Faecalibacillus intestinalis TaxID=1982626 RepID=UPI0022E1F11E|nr:DpnD/PcfM family protein [Faecalibacillus intestinalis]